MFGTAASGRRRVEAGWGKCDSFSTVYEAVGGGKGWLGMDRWTALVGCVGCNSDRTCPDAHW